jgi:hypothetical protein
VPKPGKGCKSCLPKRFRIEGGWGHQKEWIRSTNRIVRAMTLGEGDPSGAFRCTTWTPCFPSGRCRCRLGFSSRTCPKMLHGRLGWYNAGNPREVLTSRCSGSPPCGQSPLSLSLCTGSSNTTAAGDLFATWESERRNRFPAAYREGVPR